MANKVSIVLPTYNRANRLAKAIDSCLVQTHSDIEVIVVDDGSSDDTGRLVKNISDLRVKYVRHETNRKLPTALNTGFAHASGDYLTWTSDDNLYVPNAIEKLLAVLKNKGAEFVYGDCYIVEGDSETPARTQAMPDNFDPALHTGIGACFLYTRKVMQAVGEYDGETLLAEDIDYWSRVHKFFQMHHLKEALYYYRVHKGSLFESRYFDARVAGILVKAKNDILDASRLSRLLIEQCVHRIREEQPFSTFPFINRVAASVYRRYLTLMLARRLFAVIDDYKRRRLAFAEARSRLNFLLDDTLGISRMGKQQ